MTNDPYKDSYVKKSDLTGLTAPQQKQVTDDATKAATASGFEVDSNGYNYMYNVGFDASIKKIKGGV